MSADDTAAISQFVAAHAADLRSDDPTSINKAKAVLCAPLLSTSMSAAFRIAYGDELVKIVGPLAKDKRDVVAINALRIAGAAGTNKGLDVVFLALDDPRADVRMMAARGVGLSIGTARVEKNRAISPQSAKDALDALDKKMQAEKDPRVLDAMVLALSDAMKATDAELAGVRPKAMSIMLSNVGRNAGDKSMPPTIDVALAHAAKALGEALLATGADKPSPANAQNAAGVAGDIVAWILRRLDGGLSDTDRGTLALTAGECESVVQRAEKVLGTGTPPFHKLDELLRDGKDAEFRDGAKALFHDLVGDPLKQGTPPDRYPN